MHKGQDLAGACGTSVRAPGNGRVVAWGEQHSQLGNWVQIRRDTGEYVVYMHLQSIEEWVRIPNAVTYPGQVLGAVGESGTASGCHVHFEVQTVQSIPRRQVTFCKTPLIQRFFSRVVELENGGRNMKRFLVCLFWSVWFAAGTLAADVLPAWTRAARFDPVSGQWLVGRGPSWSFANTTGEQAANLAFYPGGFVEGATFVPTRVRNGYVLGVLGISDAFGFTVLMDIFGRVLFKGPLSPAFDLPEDGSAVLWVLDQGDVASVEEYCNEVLPHGFAGTMVRSCPLPTGRCELDFYPDSEAGNDFRTLSHRDILVSLRDGGWSRLRRGQRQWTSAGQSWLRL